MAGRRKSVWRVVAATLATCLLVMQSIFGSLALAAERAPARDALGGIICISHPGDDGSPLEKQGHERPSCCLLGCNIFSPGLVPAATGGLIDTRLEARDALIVENGAGPFSRPETHPRNPRAPPYLG